MFATLTLILLHLGTAVLAQGGQCTSGAVGSLSRYAQSAVIQSDCARTFGERFTTTQTIISGKATTTTTKTSTGSTVTSSLAPTTKTVTVITSTATVPSSTSTAVSTVRLTSFAATSTITGSPVYLKTTTVTDPTSEVLVTDSALSTLTTYKTTYVILTSPATVYSYTTLFSSTVTVTETVVPGAKRDGLRWRRRRSVEDDFFASLNALGASSSAVFSSFCSCYGTRTKTVTVTSPGSSTSTVTTTVISNPVTTVQPTVSATGTTTITSTTGKTTVTRTTTTTVSSGVTTVTSTPTSGTTTIFVPRTWTLHPGTVILRTVTEDARLTKTETKYAAATTVTTTTTKSPQPTCKDYCDGYISIRCNSFPVTGYYVTAVKAGSVAECVAACRLNRDGNSIYPCTQYLFDPKLTNNCVYYSDRSASNENQKLKYRREDGVVAGGYDCGLFGNRYGGYVS